MWSKERVFDKIQTWFYVWVMANQIAWALYGREFIRLHVRLGVVGIVAILLWTTVDIVYQGSQGVQDATVVSVDSYTGLPIAGHVLHPDQLPDGHYSVAQSLLHGGTIVVQHLPGPDRNFTHIVMDRFVTNVPDDCVSGDRFTIFRGKIV